MPQVTLIYHRMNRALDYGTINEIIKRNKVYITHESGRNLRVTLIGNSTSTGNGGGLEQAIIDFVRATEQHPSRVGHGSDYGVAARALEELGLALRASVWSLYIGRDVVAQK